MGQALTQNLPAQSVSVTAIDDPFSRARLFSQVPEGATVVQILTTLKVPAGYWGQVLVLFDGDVIPADQWETAAPQHGQTVVVQVFPAGGGNEFLRSFLLVAVAVAAVAVAPHLSAYVGAATWSQTAMTAAGVIAPAVLTAGGMLAVNALIPVNNPQFDNGTAVSPTLSIAARANAVRPFATMPAVLGKHRTWPMYAAKPFTELVGRDQYLRLLFVVGYKKLAITELKLGETLLSTYDDVESQILCGGATDTATSITLYPNIVDEVQVGQKLLGPASPVEQTTELDTDEFSLDLTFPNGLIRIDKSGDRRDVSVEVRIEYKAVGAGVYTTLTTLVTAASAPETIRRGYRFAFPARGQYTVRVTRLTDDLDINGTDQAYQDDCFFSTFRSITNENPVRHPNAALIALRIKATDQLSGVIDNFNVVASSILPDYDSGTGGWPERETNNPASIFRAVLAGVANSRPLTTTSTVTTLDGTPVPLLGGGLWLQGAQSRVDLDDVAEWHTECATAGRTFNMVRDAQASVWDTLHDVCAAGRGRPRHINGLWSVVRDKLQTVIRQHFTPRNSWGFTGNKSYPHTPHCFRMRFLNEDEGYSNDEMLVFDDGYDVNNATIYETLEVIGVTDPDQLWKIGRYHIAVTRLRPEVFTFSCDIEHLAVTQGDMIRVSNDAILVGLGSARLLQINLSPPDVESIDLDDAMPMEAGKSYVVRIRASDMTSTVHPVVTVAGENTTLTFVTPIPFIQAPGVGSLIYFGETDLEGMDLLVDGITMGSDMSATLKCYDAAPGIYVADEGTIPPFESHITQPPGAVVPVIESAVSDESALIREQDGTLSIRILLSFGFLNNRSEVRTLEVQYRLAGYDWWSTLPLIPGDALHASILDVRESLRYQIRARYRFIDTTIGEWSAELLHTVIGKTTPPPDVEQFFVERQPDGTRVFSWVLNDAPPDVAGFRIKYRFGHTGADWDTNMTDISDGGGLVQRSPWETNQLAAGDYQIAIKAVDTGGRESANANFITSTLGDPRIQNALVAQNEHRLGFPGTKTDCFVEATSGNLEPDGTGTWDGLAAVDWDNWNDWNYAPVAAMSYETETIDIGAIVAFDPIVTITAGGTVTIEETHSDDDITYTPLAALSGVVSARYIRIKVTVTTPELDGITNMVTILSADTIEEEIIDYDTTPDSSPAGDVRLPLTKGFTLVTTVQVALQNVGSGWSWELIDKSPTLGPRIKIYNGAILADATIDAVVKGL